MIDAKHDTVFGVVEQLTETTADYHLAWLELLLNLAGADHQRRAPVAKQAVNDDVVDVVGKNSVHRAQFDTHHQRLHGRVGTNIVGGGAQGIHP